MPYGAKTPSATQVRIHEAVRLLELAHNLLMAAGRDGSGVRRVGIRDLQAEMQQRALGPFLVRLAPPPLCLNG